MLKSCGIQLCILLVLFETNMAVGDSYETVINLKKTLLSQYDKTLRPISNQSAPLHVTVSLVLHSILGVNTVKGTMWLTISLVCEWYDQMLTWTPADHGNVTDLLIKQGEVWTPPLTLASPVEFKVMGKEWMHVHLLPDGYISWEPGDIAENACTYNLRHWPFDKQICDVMFLVYDHYEGHLVLEASEFETKFVYANSEWLIEESMALSGRYGRDPYTFSVAKFRLKLQRQSSFYVITIILPLLAIGALNSMVFILPSESGERVGYCITILLSNTVFLSVISQYLPMASDPLPIICIMLTLSVVLSFVTVFLVIISLSLYHRDTDQKIPPWFQSVACLGAPRMRRSKVENMADNRMGGVRKDNDEVMVSRVQAYKNITKDDSEKERTNERLTWKDVSCGMDKVLFATLSCMHTIPSVILLAYLVAASDYVEPELVTSW